MTIPAIGTSFHSFAKGQFVQVRLFHYSCEPTNRTPGQLPTDSRAAVPDSIVVVSTISSLIVVLFVAVLVFFICKRKRKNRTPSVEHNADETPVHGMYYFATGDHIDESNSEVVDSNDYYG